MKFFFVDSENNQQKKYEEFFSDLSNRRNRIGKYIFSENTYEIFVELIHSVVNGIPITLLDSDLSKEEIENLDIDWKEINKKEDIKSVRIKDHSMLLDKINQGKKNWELSLFTSGTTGKPKKISHKWDNLVRAVKTNSNHTKDIWAFAYNPTHFAGLQVLFQAMLNKNTMVYIFESPPNKIGDIIKKYAINRISATPTFYRKFFFTKPKPVMEIQSATLGGEKSDENFIEQMKNVFPNAKINNIYASTECGNILLSKGSNFYIDKELNDKVKISNESELLIHKSMVGLSNEIEIDGDWYATGDLVEVVDKNRFKISGRKSDVVNVAGYNVNVLEVENLIRIINGIKDVCVWSRKNKITDNILVADVIIEEDKSEDDIRNLIKEELKKRIQQWKIPQIIYFVDSLKETKSGKLVR